MKKRPFDGGRDKAQKKRQQQLGGKPFALSLEAFANAKSNNTGYNPSLIKKKREFYKNAKCVKKFKKTLKQQYHSEDHPSTSLILEVQDDNGNNSKVEETRNKKKKNCGSLQSAREEYEKRREEEEKARMEREAMIQAKKEERAKSEAGRKVLRERMFKKTRSGQPIMKHRIEHLLEGIIQSSSK